MLKRISLTLMALVVIVAGGLFATQKFLTPMSSDLSVVGQGTPTLVLAYENYSPDSGAALNQLNSLRHDYADQLRFVVADLGTPDGQAFARRHRLANGLALLLDGDGKPLKVARLSSDEASLRTQLEDKLALLNL
ncbi:hypothetical protein [Motiliproteus sediminis]|uniref:hypothetical protein n=1 Tax=Motiliproteus sediminis TaxID=1468178 RepID=UPI001AEFAF1E|nr:hypothetical protein [Motiliproteus sediminis]